MTTEAPVLRRVEAVLQAGGRGISLVTARREAGWLVEAATGKSGAELVTEAHIEKLAEEQALALARRRARGEPLQYVTGVAGFRRLELAVGPGVFIPRPETELVVERAMERLPEGGTIVDVGTGSGAIALSIAKERPDARIIATEISAEAMVWATRNRTACGARATLLLCDLLEGLSGKLRGRVDAIVSNPPYVRASDRHLLPSEVREHEPEQALFASRGGLAVLDRLAKEAASWLRTGGWLVLEIGERQAEGVRMLLEESGYSDISVHPDLAGRPRIAEARAPAGRYTGTVPVAKMGKGG